MTSVKPEVLVPFALQFAPLPSPKICNLGAIWKLSPVPAADEVAGAKVITFVEPL